MNTLVIDYTCPRGQRVFVLHAKLTGEVIVYTPSKAEAGHFSQPQALHIKRWLENWIDDSAPTIWIDRALWAANISNVGDGAL